MDSGSNIGAILAGSLLIAILGGTICLSVFIFNLAGIWKTLAKAGKPGWGAIVPIYNVVLLLEVAGRPWWWFFLLMVPGVNIVVVVVISVEIAGNFGKGALFGLGLAFLGFPFYPILGFGGARYRVSDRCTPTSIILSHVVLVIVTLLTLYPVIWVFKMAFTPAQGFSSSLNPIPTDPSFANFIYLFTKLQFVRWGVNSLIVSAATTLVGIFLSCTAAYAFSRFNFPGRREMLLGFLVTQMFPGVMMMIPLYILISKLGLLNSLLGLIIVYSTTSVPFSTWMLKGYFDTIPKDLEESAVMDGATRGMIFWKIIIPLARPAIAVVALFSFMTAWNEFILAATFMGKESMYTLPVGLRMMVGQFSTEWGHFSAGSILVSVPIVLLFFYLQKHLVSGLMAGGVKG